MLHYELESIDEHAEEGTHEAATQSTYWPGTK